MLSLQNMLKDRRSSIILPFEIDLQLYYSEVFATGDCADTNGDVVSAALVASR